MCTPKHVYRKDRKQWVFAAHWLMDHRRRDTAGKSAIRKVPVATYCTGGQRLNKKFTPDKRLRLFGSIKIFFFLLVFFLAHFSFLFFLLLDERWDAHVMWRHKTGIYMCVVLLSLPYKQCLYLKNGAFNLCVYAIRHRPVPNQYQC